MPLPSGHDCLSTIADAKISNPPWVNFQLAQTTWASSVFATRAGDKALCSLITARRNFDQTAVLKLGG
jgi:hypothetical protein